MPLTHFTDRHVVQLLATRTRRTDTDPVELSRSHADLGRFLAGELAERLDLEGCPIAHPQGVRTGFRVRGEAQVALVVLMRAGLYVAEGVRDVLRRAPIYHATAHRGTGLAAPELDALPPGPGTTYVLVDAVVNTGASLEPVLAQLRARGAARLFVVSLVAPVPTAARLEKEHPDVTFLFARVSENQYVGRGGTDTGNRLFGTP